MTTVIILVDHFPRYYSSILGLFGCVSETRVVENAGWSSLATLAMITNVWIKKIALNKMYANYIRFLLLALGDGTETHSLARQRSDLDVGTGLSLFWTSACLGAWESKNFCF